MEGKSKDVKHEVVSLNDIIENAPISACYDLLGAIVKRAMDDYIYYVKKIREIPNGIYNRSVEEANKLLVTQAKRKECEAYLRRGSGSIGRKTWDIITAMIYHDTKAMSSYIRKTRVPNEEECDNCYLVGYHDEIRGEFFDVETITY